MGSRTVREPLTLVRGWTGGVHHREPVELLASVYPESMTTTEVLVQYQQRLAELQSASGALLSKQTVLFALLALACGLFAHSRQMLPAWYPALALSPAVLAIRDWGRRRLRVKRMRRLRTHYERGIARLDGEWSGGGQAGSEFAPADHLYAADLGLFGEGSLFELLCTARTHLGRQGLARYLTDPVGSDEALQRQAAVQELSSRTELREQIALLGKYDFEESQWKTFADWLDAPAWNCPAWLRPALRVTSVSLVVLSLAALLMPVLWPTQWPVLWRMMLALSAVHGVVGALLWRRVRATLRAAGPVVAEMSVIREGLALLAGQYSTASTAFTAPKLVGLASRAAVAERAVRELDPWFLVLRERTKDWWYQLSLWLLLGTQSALAIDAWRSRQQTVFRDGLEAWAEFEALNALAGYAWEHPEDCWPEFVEGEACFEATALGHPLLARAQCVRNDVALGSGVRLWLVSGSNMAGKSTLLRSMGLASVLGLAGAPVRADGLRMAAMRVCASISIVDSLRQGKSRFLAEVQRLRDTLESSLHYPVLFLIDEIFSGTNSRDRLLAASAVVRTLVERRAIGAVSTHDIALAALAEHAGINVHMASSGADPLDFDYRVKPGITPETNALAIARLAGVPVYGCEGGREGA